MGARGVVIMSTLLLLNLLLTLFPCCTCVYLRSCTNSQFKVEDVFGRLSCINCPRCPPGYGLSPQCGGYVKYGAKIECKPCKLRVTYSATHDVDPCHQCKICSDHQEVIRNCTLESNSKCNHSCSRGFYYEDMTGDCQACSFCCSDGRNTVKDQCKDMPFYKQCDANEFSCQPKCQDDQYLVVRRKGAPHCQNCKDCPAGSSLSPQCGSIVENTDDIKCVECIAGKTFSRETGKQPCKACTVCAVGQKELRPCNLTHDRMCGKCNKGFYNVTGTECKPCSACCGDDNDVRVAECITQNMPKNKQCSFTQRAINGCQHKKPGKSTGFIIAVVTTTSIGVIAAIVILVLCTNSKYRKYTCIKQPRSQSSDEESQSHSIIPEDPIAHGAQESLTFEKSGVSIQFSDGESFYRYAQGVRLEICWDNNFIKTLFKQDEVQLSPIVKFHPHGMQLTKPAEVVIPHSTLLSYSNGWQLKLRSFIQHREEIVRKDEELFEIHNNELSFKVKNLVSYVVVGTSLNNGKPTKKRLQCAVFGGEGRVGVDYTAHLYVFDDCEASLEKVMQEERSHDRSLLGSSQSLYVESVTETDINISVKQPVEGWIVGEIKPEVIPHKSVKESYQTIPKVEVLFKHDNGRNRDFRCTFEVSAETTSTTICAVATIKEGCQPGFSNDKHEMITGWTMCDSKLLCTLLNHEDDLQEISARLDKSMPGVGNYRVVALHYGFDHYKISSVLERDYRGPSTALFEWLSASKPKLTVQEFAVVVKEKAKREDVVEVLLAYDLNNK